MRMMFLNRFQNAEQRARTACEAGHDLIDIGAFSRVERFLTQSVHGCSFRRTSPVVCDPKLRGRGGTI